MPALRYKCTCSRCGCMCWWATITLCARHAPGGVDNLICCMQLQLLFDTRDMPPAASQPSPAATREAPPSLKPHAHTLFVKSSNCKHRTQPLPRCVYGWVEPPSPPVYRLYLVMPQHGLHPSHCFACGQPTMCPAHPVQPTPCSVAPPECCWPAAAALVP